MLKNKNFWLGIVIVLSFAVFFLGKCSKEKDMSMKMNNPHNIKGVISYKRSFPDRNKVQLPEAQSYGVRSIASREEAERMKGQLQLISNCDNYEVDSLTHSVPYLVPRAAEVLNTIGLNFLDSLNCKGLNPYRIVITSVLRTQEDVKELCRRNTNAEKASAHCHGTTFDVSYKRFVMVPDPDGRPQEEVGADTLKLVLSEVLRDMRESEQCYVKYELKQGCFHVTARKPKR